MFKLKSNHIKDFPFWEYTAEADLESLSKQHHLTAHNSWMLPQIAAHYGSWKLQRNHNGLVDPSLTAKHNAGTDPWELGLWRVCTQLRRGLLVKQQTAAPHYSALVPLILAGVKQFQGVGFQQWDLQQNCPLVDPQLLEAMLWRDPDLFDQNGYCTLGSQRLLEIRAQGLTTKSGAKAGVVAKPTSAWCLKGIRDTELGHAPKLVGTMLCQIWVAHPSLRNQYMVLDPYHWDAQPAPIGGQEVFVQHQPAPANARKTTTVNSSNPW